MAVDSVPVFVGFFLELCIGGEAFCISLCTALLFVYVLSPGLDPPPPPRVQ